MVKEFRDTKCKSQGCVTGALNTLIIVKSSVMSFTEQMHGNMESLKFYTIIRKWKS